MYEGEVWKDVVGYEGFYQVSNLGRVRSLNRTIRYSDGREYSYEGKIMRQTLNKRRGYKYVRLNKKGHSKNISVHRLVAETFLPLIDNANEVNHKNGDKKDNKLENLEWVTRKENAEHAIQHNLMKSGAKHYAAKFSNEQVREFRKNYNKGVTLTSLSIMGGVNVSTMFAIVNRKTYKKVD